jgi:Sigma-70, region 4
MAVLVLLESLSPAERAVFLLREVFGCGYDEIAEAVDKSGAACRQIFARALHLAMERMIRFGARVRRAWVNGQPGVLTYDADGGLIAVIVFDVLDGQIQAIRAVANPDKLRHLRPISSIWQLNSREEQGDEG